MHDFFLLSTIWIRYDGWSVCVDLYDILSSYSRSSSSVGVCIVERGMSFSFDMVSYLFYKPRATPVNIPVKNANYAPY